jgi:uncharacterized membrane protein YbjE (DUF340 family)
MKLVALYFGMIFIGYVIGSHLRKKEKKIRWGGKVMVVMIIFLIFLMGSRLSANDEVVKSLGTIGLTSFVLTLFILLGSALAVMVARKLLGINGKGVRDND